MKPISTSMVRCSRILPGTSSNWSHQQNNAMSKTPLVKAHAGFTDPQTHGEDQG